MAERNTRHRTSRLQTKGQVTVPQEARDELGLSPGDEVVWVRNETGHWEIWAAEDFLDRLTPTLDGLPQWLGQAKQGYRPKRP